MQLIIISLLFIFGFCFVGILTLSYAIYLWEKQKIENLTKDIAPVTSSVAGGLGKRAFSTMEQSVNNKPKMKIPQQVSVAFENTLVVVKSQDYKGWLEKTTTIVKKIGSNLGIYSSYIIQKIITLTKKNDNLQNIEEIEVQDTKTEKQNAEINKTAERISNLGKPENSSSQTFSQNNNANFAAVSPEENNGNEVVEIATTKSSFGATLDLANDNNKTKNTSKDVVYEKIENSILERLKKTGLTEYPVWIELAKHYEKFDEREKAIEIYAMVMKHSNGREKEIARDGLIALS